MQMLRKDSNIKYDLKRGSEEVFNDYLRRLEHYKHFQDPIDRTRKFFNNPLIKGALNQKYGDNFIHESILKSIDDVALDMSGGDKLPMVNKIKRNFVTGVLGGNLILFPKQMMSVSAYRTGLKSGKEELAFSQYMTKGWGDKAQWDMMKELNGSEFMFNRKMGNSFNRRSDS